MARHARRTSNGIEILRKRYVKKSSKRKESIERERENLNIAEQIYNLRTEANLTQNQLANLIGTTQSVVSRLEDADYDGHSLAVLRKIATALHKRVQVKFVPQTKKYAYS